MRALPRWPAVLGLGLAASLVFSVPASADPSDLRAGLALPPGTHADAQGQLVSGRGLRDTSDFLTKELEHRGITVERIGPYAVRGVELTRFISQTPSTPWLAIHTLRVAGKTMIFFVPRSKSP